MLVANCYVCGELLLLTRVKTIQLTQVKIRADQFHDERHASGCLSFRQRVIAKKAVEINNRNNFSFFNRSFDAVIGISLAELLQPAPEAKTFVHRRCSSKNPR